MKNIATLVTVFLTTISFAAFSQIGALNDLKIDSVQMLRTSAQLACKCIDSININEKGNKEISEGIKNCIDNQTGAYQLISKLMSASANNSDKAITINYNIDKESNEYKRYYFQIEHWLMDSCASLKLAVASNNDGSEFSYSNDPKAASEYNDGVDYMQKEKYKEALAHFEKAVKIDDKFAFAWDNIGLCNRRLGKLDDALKAYNKSLQISPLGKTPLQNIPVVYEFKKDYDKALKGYSDMLSVYPTDPESYYGMGRIYLLYKEDFENGLQNMCKAYNLYIEQNSPYRVDAEKNIQYIYGKMKAAGNEDRFNKILKENNITPQ
ncbi:tetratricopeptide repeat protein [Ferruginibacter sp. SUN002]|uniref:tetratricopeptide repeat protein n=1 Tax=Ferruginibacter sp. SUN002 TaxID=2937789 RepID=UPI003D36DEF8